MGEARWFALVFSCHLHALSSWIIGVIKFLFIFYFFVPPVLDALFLSSLSFIDAETCTKTLARLHGCTGTTVFKAKAFAENFIPSEEASAKITVAPQVGKPSMSPEGGEFVDHVTVTVTCATEEATILYTTQDSVTLGAWMSLLEHGNVC